MYFASFGVVSGSVFSGPGAKTEMSGELKMRNALLRSADLRLMEGASSDPAT